MAQNFDFFSKILLYINLINIDFLILQFQCLNSKCKLNFLKVLILNDLKILTFFILYSDIFDSLSHYFDFFLSKIFNFMILKFRLFFTKL